MKGIPRKSGTRQSAECPAHVLSRAFTGNKATGMPKRARPKAAGQTPDMHLRPFLRTQVGCGSGILLLPPVNARMRVHAHVNAMHLKRSGRDPDPSGCDQCRGLPGRTPIRCLPTKARMNERTNELLLSVHAVRRAPPPVSSHQLLRALRAFVVKQIVFYCHCWFVRHCGWG